MSIHFKTVRWKNFLSTGDSFTEISLDTHASTLIVGPNGSGKSTMLDALSFALFGKPHRDINKPQLINSINDKNCVVEVEFSVGPVEYRVVRGLKPGIFEIYQNGTLVNQEAHSRDYQKVLEQNILKLNHKSFHQIVVLGSSSFVPFMQLSAQNRREVIEDLLDINIFTKMNVVLKEKVARLRENVTTISGQLELMGEKTKLQQKYIQDLEALDREQVEKNREKIQQLQNQIDSLLEQNESYQADINGKHDAAKQSLSKAHDNRHTLQSYAVQIDKNISTVVKEAKFYEENSVCPTCTQSISEEVKKDKIHVCRSKAKDLSDGKTKAAEELSRIDSRIREIEKIIQECTETQNKIRSNNLTVSSLEKQRRSLEKDALEKKSADIDSAREELGRLTQESVTLTNQKALMYEEGTYNQALSEMLKDTGIKTKVIRQYLPVMNRLINGYLNILDFFVSFNLDESFEESIKSRHRDDFSYASFSEGEKQRIDLALLFTWRQIARMKNSISTNLLVLDETFDSSMDGDGVENLIKILSTLEDDTNVFIISHKTDALDGKFKNKMEFYKDKNFSKCKK